ncbi:hypothetical protein Tco_1184963 [Tanacetum coccineum]
MRTRNSNFPNNSNVTIPRRRNRGRAPNVVEPELRTIVEVAPMAERTMEELLRAPTEGYGEAIVLPEINADHFEIKTNLLQLVQANPFHGIPCPVWGCDRLVIRAKVIENQIMAASAIAISSDSSDGPPSQDPYVATVARWRSRVTARPSSSSEFPIAPVTAPPRIRRRSAILIRPGEAIPFGRPYRTHLNGPRKLLTARKRVGPLPARRLAWRHASPRSSDHHSSSSSSSSDSSPVHSSGLDASDQAHFGSSTIDVPPRLFYPLRRALRRSEAFHRWCAAPLSTLYPPTTSEPSSRDSSEIPLYSSSHSAGPSRKRCRSRLIIDSYSFEASMEEEDTEIDPIETKVDMELGIGDGYDVRYHVEIDPRDVRDDTEEYKADVSAGDTVQVGTDIKKKTKIKTKPDKTEHEIEKSARKRDQGCLQILMGQPVTHLTGRASPIYC